MAILPTAPVRRVLEALPANTWKPKADYWIARCPAHEDARESLSIGIGRDGRALLKCHAGCDTAAIASAIGLSVSELFADAKPAHANGNGNGRHPADVSAPTPTRARPSVVKTYAYTDEDGRLLYEAVRLEPKDFRQRRPTPSGEWDWKLGDVRRVLYRLPDVIEAAAHERPIFLVEGEKDAETLAAERYCATTWAGGAKGWRDEYAQPLARATVVCLPDNDEPGRQAMHQAAAALTAAGARVKIVELPGLAPKGDVTDWIGAGHSLDELDELVERAPLWHPDGTNRTRWRLDELFENENIMRPPPAIVPRLAWAGRSTLLAAREKIGKSTLTGYIAAQVSRGGEFLGQRCQQGAVLLVGLEEFIGDAARRLRDFRADPRHIAIVDRFVGDPRERPQELAAHIEAVDPVLVIVDSLAAYSQGQIQDDNNATQMTAVLQPLTDLAHTTAVALVLIHHARKTDGRARGSTAITAAADVVCEISAPNEDTDPTLRRMRAAGRVPVPRVYDFRFDGDTYVLAGADEAPLEQRILSYVQSHPKVSTRDVREAVGGRHEDVQRVVTQLLTTGALQDFGSEKGRSLVVAGSVGQSFF